MNKHKLRSVETNEKLRARVKNKRKVKVEFSFSLCTP